MVNTTKATERSRDARAAIPARRSRASGSAGRAKTELARSDVRRERPTADSTALRRFQQALERFDASPLSREQRLQLGRLHKQFDVFTASIAGSTKPRSRRAVVAAGIAANDGTPTAEQLRQAWVDEGLLVSGSDLAKAWSRTRQAIDQARGRSELFGVRVKNAYLYPAGFAQLPAESVGKVNRQLGGGDAVAKFIFWTRPHGGAGGMTIAALIAKGNVARAIELAQGWSAEHGVGTPA